MRISMNFKYFLMRLLSVALAFTITFSLIAFVFGICNVVMFQNRNFIKNSIILQKDAFVSDIGDRFEEMQDAFSVPVDALKLALENDVIELVAGTVSDNFVYSYSTDFTDNEELYNSFSSAISYYCRENNINVSEKDITVNASLAVTALNKELGGVATRGVGVFELSKNRLLAIMIAVSAVLFLAAYFILDFINYGRHRKYSYIGMGVITAGYVMTLIPLYVKSKGFVKNFNHCNIDLYNSAINNLYSYIFNISIIVGVILFIAGAITLIINYRYFKNKGERVKAARESSEQMMNEYIEQYNEKQRLKGKGNKPTSGRHVMKIDFDDEE